MKSGLSKKLIEDCFKQMEKANSLDGPSTVIVRDDQGQAYAVKTRSKARRIAFVYKTDKKHVIPSRVFFLRKERNM